ncbi:hypothetical protein WOLCODRAFT_24975 [Wolfiporia cocos MD-104 SS10]|uniref:Uncharacterized protein n=1 Tax=Wolfiporia cocos (strain MD-104) TaxID=742152 RepID=A0A2H3K045_WOLCO|nr:hypothetical protein WOLCODRAFT_24975 [Wolfiporia cocos MD-104 SS10]
MNSSQDAQRIEQCKSKFPGVADVFMSGYTAYLHFKTLYPNSYILTCILHSV